MPEKIYPVTGVSDLVSIHRVRFVVVLLLPDGRCGLK